MQTTCQLSIQPEPKPEVWTKAKGRYSDSIRQCAYFCSHRQVHLHSISPKAIGPTLFDQQLAPLSCTSVGNMVHEMGILALEHAVEAILDSEYVNLCGDVTFADGQHK